MPIREIPGFVAHCDSCNQETPIFHTAERAGEEALMRGWDVQDDRFTCPDCKEEAFRQSRGRESQTLAGPTHGIQNTSASKAKGCQKRR